MGATGALGLGNLPFLIAPIAAAESDLRPITDLEPLATVYDDVSGHHITGKILDHWLQHGRIRVFGHPISEPLITDGRTMQFFESGVLSEDPDTRDPSGVSAMNLGQTWWDANSEAFDISSVDARSSYWMRWTGRGVNPEFWVKYLNEGAAFSWGYPITWGQVVDDQLTQVYQKTRFIMTADGPVLDPLGRWLAKLWSIDTTPVGRLPGIVPYRADRFAPDYGPLEERRVDINLTEQIARFYAGDQMVYPALISSGRHPNYTWQGTFNIFSRIIDERMTGGTEEEGNQYDTWNVYYTQYFTRSWIALHYAYWHDEFGVPQSHGCVNMRLDDSRWAWFFCGVGTQVTVHS